MKKSFLTNCSYFLTLLFLTIIAPIFISNDAHAACTLAGTGAAATCTSNTPTTETCAVAANGTSCTGTAVAAGGNSGNTVRRADPALSNQNAFVDTICNALKLITGNGGKAFAAFAIISLGIGFFTGKVSWGLMIGVAAGIAAMFGAPTIVAAISGDTAYDCRTVAAPAN